METEAIYVISDESDQEDSLSTRRKADDQDPLEGKRILRNKKPKVKKLEENKDFKFLLKVLKFYKTNQTQILDRK